MDRNKQNAPTYTDNRPRSGFRGAQRRQERSRDSGVNKKPDALPPPKLCYSVLDGAVCDYATRFNGRTCPYAHSCQELESRVQRNL
jgi:hypothetical protein